MKYPVKDPDGYSLSSVTWGYRDIFSKTIQRLFDEGYLGPEREEITRQFFSLLQCSEATLYDHVLKEFLDSLTGDSAWIFDLPVIFGEIIRTGSNFAEAKMFYGIEFYRILKDGGFGDSPDKVQFLLTWIKKLSKIDMELSFAFLKGYQALLERLRPPEIQHYVEEGVRLFRQNTQTGLRFIECKLQSSDTYIRELTRECRLEDVVPSLERLLRALTGITIPIVPLADLGPGEGFGYDGGMICLHHRVGLPERIRRSATRRENYSWYLLEVISAAAHYLGGGFPVLHGLKEYASFDDAAGKEAGLLNLAAIAEYRRALDLIVDRWPGALPVLRRGLEEELPVEKILPGPEAVLRLVLRELLRGESGDDRIVGPIKDIVARSENVIETVRIARRGLSDFVDAVLPAFPDFLSRPVRPPSFLPDFTYKAAVPPAVDPFLAGDAADVTDGFTTMGDLAEEMLADGEDREVPLPEEGEFKQEGSGNDYGDEAEEPVLKRFFLYDEWTNEEGAYLKGHCRLVEEYLSETQPAAVPESALDQVSKVRRVFEMLKPVVINKIKRLADGDDINHDMLIRYLVESNRDPSPKIDFYERPLVDRRDLSVLVLLDVSGSTEEEVEGERIIDIEKHAALILGQGLASLGDRFSLAGFSSNGRDDCRYFPYKDFTDPWGHESISRLYAAESSSSTRIGVALRHAGFRLLEEPSKQRLIILVTDGRPMDQGYDPETRYAQHDVRMACEENRKNGILTFCVSTMENSRADMEIMFPERRFVILKNITQLPKVLPQLYIRLTT